MNGNRLLDTNIVIAFINDETAIVDAFRNANNIYLPVVVLGELFFGARKSTHTQHNLAQIDQVMQRMPTLDCDVETSRQYGSIKNQLRRDGSPIPDNDIWIAAIAMQHDLTLVTRDEHFQNVTDLSLEAW